MNKEVISLIDEYINQTYRLIFLNEFESRTTYHSGEYEITTGSFLNGYMEFLEQSDNVFISISEKHGDDYVIDVWPNKVEIDTTQKIVIDVDESLYDLTEDMYMQLNFVYDLTNISYPNLSKLFYICGVLHNNVQQNKG